MFCKHAKYNSGNQHVFTDLIKNVDYVVDGRGMLDGWSGILSTYHANKDTADRSYDHNIETDAKSGYTARKMY